MTSRWRMVLWRLPIRPPKEEACVGLTPLSWARAWGCTLTGSPGRAIACSRWSRSRCTLRRTTLRDPTAGLDSWRPTFSSTLAASARRHCLALMWSTASRFWSTSRASCTPGPSTSSSTSPRASWSSRLLTRARTAPDTSPSALALSGCRSGAAEASCTLTRRPTCSVATRGNMRPRIPATS